MIKIHSGEIFQYAKENFNIELLLGGYHGKGEMIFAAVLILRFRTKNCGYHIMERRRTSGLSAMHICGLWKNLFYHIYMLK